MRVPLLELPWVKDTCRALHPGGEDGEERRLAWALDPRAVPALAGHPFTHRTLAPLAGRIERAGLFASLPPQSAAILGAARAWGVQKAGIVRRILAPLGALCAAQGLRPVLLKGTAHHGLLYADPSDRPCADVDVLVEAAAIPRLHGVLLRLGFQPDMPAGHVAAMRTVGGPRPWQCDLVYYSPENDHVLEVKADPIAMGPPIRRVADLARPGPPSPLYPGLSLPQADVAVVYQALHLVRRSGPDLLGHAELAGVLVRRREEVSTSGALDLLRGEGLNGVLRRVLEDTEAAFPGSVPRAFFTRRGRPAGLVPSALRAGTLTAGARRGGRRRLALLAPRLLGGAHPSLSLRWLLGMVFPPEPLLWALAAPGVGNSWLRPLRRLRARVRSHSRDPRSQATRP